MFINMCVLYMVTKSSLWMPDHNLQMGFPQAFARKFLLTRLLRKCVIFPSLKLRPRHVSSGLHRSTGVGTAPSRVVRAAERCRTNSRKITNDLNYPKNALFSLLQSGKRIYSLKANKWEWGGASSNRPFGPSNNTIRRTGPTPTPPTFL